jgi:hypothetical protein
MKRKTVNVNTDFGVYCETSFYEGGFRIIAENERQKVILHLANSQFVDLLWSLGEIAKKRTEEAAEMVAVAPGATR